MDTPRKAEPSRDVRRIAVGLVEAGEEPAVVAAIVGVAERSVWRWLSGWRRGGDAALATRARSGRPPKLTPAVGGALLRWLERSATEFGFATERWTARRLAAVLARERGVGVNRRYLSDWLDRHGVTPQLPQRVPRERDEAAVAAWVRERWPAIKKTSATAARPWRSATRAGSCSCRWSARRSPAAGTRRRWCTGPATATRSRSPRP
jgi:putative transposase